MSLKSWSASWKVTQPGVVKLDSLPGLSAPHTPTPHCGAGPRACFPVYKDNQGLSDWGAEIGRASKALSPGVLGVGGGSLALAWGPCPWATRSGGAAHEPLPALPESRVSCVHLWISPCRAADRVVLGALLGGLWVRMWSSHPGESLAVSFARSFFPSLSHAERSGRSREMLPVVSLAGRPSRVLCC